MVHYTEIVNATVETLNVDLGERSYPILIGGGLLQDAALLAQHVTGPDLLLVSNTTVAPLYSRTLEQCFPDRRIVQAILPDGESYKTLAAVGRLLDVLVANRFGRDATI